jgi:hypothetical protein
VIHVRLLCFGLVSMRMLDESEDISRMLELIYGLYEEEQVEHLPNP